MSICTAHRKANDDYETVFHALSHPTRRQVLILLNAAGGRLTAGELAARFSHKWPTVTRHLRILEKAGLLTAAKSSREQLYSFERSRLENTIGNWMAWFA
jgi:DNA-binding transcriptional ArsR family regulator